jgi:hypothetical protein
VYHTTGLSRDQITCLCVMIQKKASDEGVRFWPPILGLFRSMVVTLTYMRRNRVQAELAETYEVSQPTISRAISRLTPIIEGVLSSYVPTADELDDRTQYLADGTLLPCWSWRSCPGLWSGKHKTTGMNVQVVCDLRGRLAWISDPIEGSRHDTHCLRESAALSGLDSHNWIGDKGHVGNNMITPIKRSEGRDLLDWEKEYNKQINKVRAVVERVIANFKNWEIIHTDYRRPLDTFTKTISAVIALHFYQLIE